MRRARKSESALSEPARGLLPKPQVSFGLARKRPLRAIESERAGRIRIIKYIEARIAVIAAETELVRAHRVSESLIDVAGGVDASERRR